MQEAVTAAYYILEERFREWLTFELTIISTELGSENARIEKLGF